MDIAIWEEGGGWEVVMMVGCWYCVGATDVAGIFACGRVTLSNFVPFEIPQVTFGSRLANLGTRISGSKVWSLSPYN